MSLIDTHCHYNLEPLYNSWEQHWLKAQEAGVSKSIVVGTTLETSKTALTIVNSQRHQQQLFASIAIHPTSVSADTPESTYKEFSSLITQDAQDAQKANQGISQTTTQTKKIIAIGETGLDYFRLPRDQQAATQIKHLQQASFKKHIALAQTHRLPLILHVRDTQTPEEITPGNAYWDVLALLEESFNWETPLILHCFSGPKSYAQAFIERGAFLGLAGNTTYPNSHQLREIIRQTPPTQLLLETDAPFLPPQQYRGQTCEPWMVSLTAEFLSSELEISAETLWNNAHKAFNLPE